MCRGKARVEFNCLLELGRRAFGSACPHANEGQCEVRVWITRVQRYRSLSEFKGFLVCSLRILGPTQICRYRQCDRKRRGGLRRVRFIRKRTSKIRLRLQVIRLVLPVVVEHAALIELVSIIALL